MKSLSTYRIIQDGGLDMPLAMAVKLFAACFGLSIGNKSNSSIEETRNIALFVHYGVILCHEWWKS